MSPINTGDLLKAANDIDRRVAIDNSPNPKAKQNKDSEPVDIQDLDLMGDLEGSDPFNGNENNRRVAERIANERIQFKPSLAVPAHQAILGNGEHAARMLQLADEAENTPERQAKIDMTKLRGNVPPAPPTTDTAEKGPAGTNQSSAGLSGNNAPVWKPNKPEATQVMGGMATPIENDPNAGDKDPNATA